MLDISKDVQSLTDFKTKTPRYLQALRKSRRAMLLTVNGRAEVAVMSAATFQEVLDDLELLETLRSLRDGLKDAKAGKGQPASEFFSEIRKKHKLPKSA